MKLGIVSILLATVLVELPRADTNWPQFRGPNGDGHSAAAGLALTWSETENVRWKTAIHGLGWSSPVVWGSQVWLTTATEDGKEQSVLCIDRDSGKVLLDRKLFENPSPEPLGNDVNTYASPTPVIEDGRVYIHFGSFGTACLDTETFKTVWERRDLPCRHYRGPSSSPILFENLLILTFDGADLQYTAALDKKTGETVWKTDRSADWSDLGPDGKPQAEGDLRKAHSTPVITTVDGKPLMISAGAKAAYGYDPRTGKEIWKATHKGYSASWRPLVADGIAYLSTGYSGFPMWAIKLDGQGDITESHIVWKYAKNVPRKPSPLLIDDLLFLLDDSGVVTCVESKTGEEVWKERIGGNFSASSIYADGRIYCFSEQGKTIVLKPGRKLEILAESQLDSGFMASPAVSGKSLILRTKSHLYRIDPPA